MAEIDGGGQGQNERVYVDTRDDFGCNQWQANPTPDIPALTIWEDDGGPGE